MAAQFCLSFYVSDKMSMSPSLAPGNVFPRVRVIAHIALFETAIDNINILNKKLYPAILSFNTEILLDICTF